MDVGLQHNVKTMLNFVYKKMLNILVPKQKIKNDPLYNMWCV